MKRLSNHVRSILNRRQTQTILLSLILLIILTTVTVVLADVLDRTPPRGTVPNPGTQQQELANITAPAPYNTFEFVGTCAACHGGTIDQNAGHFGNWAGTSMASSARDPVFRANQIGVNNIIKGLTGEDGAGNICMRCHSPNGWMSGRFDPTLAGDAQGRTMEHSILLSTDDEGVLCEFCHRAIGNVTFKRADLYPADPAWNMLAGISDWPHTGRAYEDQDGSGTPTIAQGNPLGDATLQINDGMTYVGKYSGSVDIYSSDTPLAGTDYTGQTYGVYPDFWPTDPIIWPTGPNGEVINPDGSVPIHFEAPIGPPLNGGVPDYQAQAISLEHPTAGGRPGLDPQPVPDDNGFLRSSEFCGSCHDLTVPILNHGMPEQRTYTEWKFSRYGEDGTRCQDCHMPTQKHEYTDDAAVSLNPDPTLTGWFPYGKDRNPDGGTAFHKFAGANRDLPMMMKELYPEPDLELIGALTGNDTRVFPGMLSTRDPMYDRAQRNSELSLHEGVDVAISQAPTWVQTDPNDITVGYWEMQVTVTNNAGHRIPSGYPDGRRFWLDVQVTDNNGVTVYESGYYDEVEAELLTAPGVAFNRALEPTIDVTGGQLNAVMVYERVTGTCVDSTGAAIFPDPTAGTPDSCTASPALTNNFILFDNRIMPAGFDYEALSAAGVKFWNYDPATMVPTEDADRFPAGQGYDVVTYRFDALYNAVLEARAEVYWQTHTRDFMVHLRDQDTSTVRPEGPPSIFEPNYPLTPNYLSDQIGLDTIDDPYNIDSKGRSIPLNDNWGGIAYASWLLTGKGAPYLVGVADTAAVSITTAPVLSVIPVDLFTLELSWNAMPGAEGYKVFVSLGLDDDTADWDELAVVYGTSFTHEALNVGKSYRYKVRAFNGAGEGPESTIATATTPIDVPLPPENLTAYRTKPRAISLSWLDVADNEVGFVIQRQDVPVTGDFYDIATMDSQTAGGATGGNNLIDDGSTQAGVTWAAGYTPPKPGSTYNYRVAAFNNAGMSTWSLPVQAVTAGPPGAPTNLVAVLGAANSVDLTWDAATGDVGGYRVERSNNGTTFSAIATLGPTALSYNDADDLALLPGNTYWYQVIAFNAEGDSQPSNVASILIPVEGAPADPTNLIAAVVWSAGGPEVNLTWNDNAADETGYYVERAQDPDPNNWTVIATTDTFNGTGSYTDGTVAPNETHHYRVQAFILPTMVSNYSNVATAIIPNQIPETPSGLTVVKTWKDRIELGWLDNATNEESFELQRASDDGGVPGAWVDVTTTLPPNTTSYLDSGLARKTTYWYHVRACNANGCSAWTAEVPGTTK